MATDPSNVESDITHSQGDSGTKPPDGRFFVNEEDNYSDSSAEESVNADTYNWLFSTWISKFNGLAADVRNILDGTYTVSTADYANDANASTYKGNDIDADGNGKVDQAENADDASTLQNNSPSDLRVAIEDAGTVVLSAVPNINFGSNLSVTDDGDGTVTVTGTAETYPSVSEDGTVVESSSTDINFGNNLTASSDSDGTTTVSTDNDATSYKGNDIDSNGDGKVDSADIADNAKLYKGNDIDSNGDGKVDNADKLDGNDASAFNTDSSTGVAGGSSSSGRVTFSGIEPSLTLFERFSELRFTNTDTNNSYNVTITYDDGTTKTTTIGTGTTKWVSVDSSKRVATVTGDLPRVMWDGFNAESELPSHSHTMS